MPTQILASPCGDWDPWPRELVHVRYDWPETWNMCGVWWGSGCAAVDSTWCWLVMAMIRMQVCWWYRTWQSPSLLPAAFHIWSHYIINIFNVVFNVHCDISVTSHVAQTPTTFFLSFLQYQHTTLFLLHIIWLLSSLLSLLRLNSPISHGLRTMTSLCGPSSLSSRKMRTTRFFLGKKDVKEVHHVIFM